ncbi:MAG: tyrosine-type recombinase/integrase [Candidatus Aenigmarchaeota archaeon]|nr:tyrosine-type recombinase/integrase [Candidatus Aenigmarchaeota archaeon]
MDSVERSLESLKQRIVKLGIPQENEKAIMDFDTQCYINGLRPATRLCYMKSIYYLVRKISKPFSEITKEDIVTLFESLRNGSGDRTMELAKLSIKKFFKFLNNGEYPEIVSWIKENRNNKYKLPEELLTKEEIKKMAEACDSVRDRAFVLVLYDSACRLGEMLSLRIKHCTFDEHGAILMVDGKTGQRRVRLINSSPDLKEWLNNHPHRDDPDAHLWVSVGRKNFGKPMSQVGIQHRILIIATRAEIKKYVHPHLFRHSRLTDLAKSGFNEAQLRKFAGWAGSSKMAAVYIHLSGQDIDDKLLEINGIKKVEPKDNGTLKPKDCPRCGKLNPATFKVCQKCWMPLDLKTVMEIEEKRRLTDSVMDKLMERPNVRDFLEHELGKIIKEEGGITFLKDEGDLP